MTDNEVLALRVTHLEQDIAEMKQQRREDMQAGERIIEQYRGWKSEVDKQLVKLGAALGAAVVGTNGLIFAAEKLL